MLRALALPLHLPSSCTLVATPLTSQVLPPRVISARLSFDGPTRVISITSAPSRYLSKKATAAAASAAAAATAVAATTGAAAGESQGGGGRPASTSTSTSTSGSAPLVQQQQQPPRPLPPPAMLPPCSWGASASSSPT